METPPMILPISPISMWCQGPSHYLRCPHVSGNLHGSLAPDYPVSGKFGQFDRKRPRKFLDLAGEKAAFLVYSLGNKWGKLQKMADGPNHLQRWLGTPEKILQLETQLYTITTLKWWCITCSFLPFGFLFGCYKSKILRGWRLHLTWATLGNSGRFSDFPIQFLKPSGFGGLPAFSKGVSQWCHCHGEASGILELADSFQVKLWRPIVRLKVPAAPSFSIQSIEEMRSLNVDIYYILESSYTYQ